MPEESVLSVFVDESGRFVYPDRDSRFYILGMVFHDQSDSIKEAVLDLERGLLGIGIDPEAFVFQTGPLIRREKSYAILSRNFRGRIYARLMTFARRVIFKYHCIHVDKKFIGSSLQIVGSLKNSLELFIASHMEFLKSYDKVKIYYDCGQSPITNLLHLSFKAIGGSVEFIQNVQPCRYRLFQLADFICTLSLIHLKILRGEPLTESEWKFFGGRKAFIRNELKLLKSKLLQ